jgi:anthranilate phosphoribosyltransferase
VTDPIPATTTWPGLVSTLLARRDLTRTEAEWAMDQVMGGDTTPVQLAAFLVALRAKGETVQELAGLAEAMLRHAVRIDVDGDSVDVVGTGGDRHHTVNISTMAALVVAGTGRRVVKHGNRAATSSSGAADVLEALGVRLDQPPARVAELAVEVGITFCFALRFHPALRHAAQARSELGVPTAFNFLGPLTNPAQPRSSAIGVYDERMAGLVAGVLAARGRSALVFRGEDGLDEMSTTAPTRVWLVVDGQIHDDRVDAVRLGLPRAGLADLRGGDAAHNAAVVRDVLSGRGGPVRDAVLLNAAGALVALAPGEGTLPDQLTAAMARAAEAVDSGAAAGALDTWVRTSRELAAR